MKNLNRENVREFRNILNEIERLKEREKELREMFKEDFEKNPELTVTDSKGKERREYTTTEYRLAYIVEEDSYSVSTTELKKKYPEVWEELKTKKSGRCYVKFL